MNEIRFAVEGVPQPKGSAKAFRHHTTGRIIVQADNRDKLKVWEHAVRIEAMRVRPRCRWMGPVAVEIAFHLPRPKSAGKRAHPMVRPDIDKLLRAAIDPLSGVLFNDDKQVVSVAASKVYVAPAGKCGALVTVREIEAETTNG